MYTLRDSLRIEDRSEVLDFRFTHDDIVMWPFIRVYLHRVPLFKAYGFLSPYGQITRAGPAEKALYFARTLRRRCFGPRPKERYQILMFCSGVANVDTGRGYVNRLSDYFAALREDETLLVEDSVKRRYLTPRCFPHVIYHDAMLLEAHLGAHLRGVDKRDAETVRALLRMLEEEFPFPLEREELRRMEQTLRAVAVRLPLYHRAYERLYDAVKPRVVFLEDASYGERSYVLKWARERNIVTAEMQHGMIYPDHVAYNYGEHLAQSVPYRKYLPGYFMTYGAYWNDKINLPSKKVTVGNPNYSENARKAGPDRRPGGRTRLLIVSGGAIPDDMQRVTLEAERASSGGEPAIVFRPHPSEIPHLGKRYPGIMERPAVEIDTGRDLYRSMARSDFVAGDLSTVLFEALGVCRAVFAIDHPFADLAVPKTIIGRFRTGEELVERVRSHRPEEEIDRDRIWAPDWKKNYRGFIAGLLGE